jgi:WD40 repeat protein
VNFCRSPDGSCFLTNSDDNSLRIFDLPSDTLQETQKTQAAMENEDSFSAAIMVPEGETVYDFCWYPYMLASDAATCCFAASTRDHPVHLWDAVTGELRCTYRAYDAMDEIAAAYSIAFNPTGSKLYCGYNKTLRVFDIARPGKEFSQYSTLTKTKDGQTGTSALLFVQIKAQ